MGTLMGKPAVAFCILDALGGIKQFEWNKSNEPV